MSTATTDEVRDSLPDLLQKVQMGPIFIRQGDEDVAVLVSAEDYRRDRLNKVERFERSRDALAAKLEAGLSRDELTMQEFMADLLAE